MAGIRPLQVELETLSRVEASESRSLSGKRVATRHRLMDACGEIIVRQGFSAVSMSSVAEKAGITRQTVYGYFSNSRDMI
ncbi:MAG TPA: TetR/AcrR family transcriptional regulator, partial [Deltaproteobacteria bacterium]|nr:TetR/AcrR family transcriptional regulator [Deltaproteobacteria bacterium]